MRFLIAICSLWCGITLILPSAMAVQATGNVFLDANRNGRRDPGESGVKNIMVSDSEQVVRTDEKGAFHLSFDVNARRFIFLTRPSGFQVTTPWYLKIEPPAFDPSQIMGKIGDPTVRYDFTPSDSGKRLADKSGHGNDAQVTLGDEGGWIKTPSGPALLFSAKDDRVILPFKAFDGQAGAIRLRLRFDNLKQNQTLFRVYTLGDGMSIVIKDDRIRISYYVRSRGKWMSTGFSTHDVKPGNWYTLTAMWDTGRELDLLLDGKTAARLPMAIKANFTQTKQSALIVGNELVGGHRPFQGAIASVELWGRQALGGLNNSTSVKDAYTVDFGIAPDANPANRPGADFTILAGGDIQYDLTSHEKELRYDWQTFESLSKSRDIAFATWAGDLTPFGKLKNLQLLQTVERTLSYPTYNAYGGHDGIEEGGGTSHYEQVLGPWAYSWDYAGRHFVTFVSEDIFLKPQGIMLPRQKEWIKNDLAALDPGTQVFFVTHRPGIYSSILDQATQRLKVVGVLRGHYHQTYFYYSGKTHIPVICSSPIRKDQAGVFTKQPRLIHFSGDKVTSRIVPLGQEQRAVVVWPQPGAVVSNKVPLTLLINAYNSGSLVKKVTYTIGGPAGEVKVDQPLTQETSWSWRDELPAGQLAPGEYVLKVGVSDDQGRTWNQTSQFTVSSQAPEAAKLGGNWLSYYGPDGHNRVTSDTPSPHLRLAWAAPVGSTESGKVSYGNPLVRDGVVYAPVRDDNVGWPQGGIVAFDALTGQRRWKASIGSVWHSPVILGDRLYAVSSEGMVHAIDLGTHKVIWTFDIYQDQGFSHRLATAPVAAGPDCVIVGADNSKFFCLDARSGKPRWAFKIGNVAGMVAGAFVDGNAVYLADQESLYALNLKDGSLIWKHKLGYRQRVFGSPFVKDGRLYLNQHGRISAFDVTQGCRRLWNVGTEDYKFTLPVVRDGQVYTSEAAGLFGRSTKDGSKTWQIPTDVKAYMDHNKFQEVIDASSHALAGSYDFVGSDNGCFYVIDLKSGKPVTQFFIGPPVKSSAAISGNMVFVGSTDGNLYAFAPALAAPTPQSEKSIGGSTTNTNSQSR